MKAVRAGNGFKLKWRQGACGRRPHRRSPDRRRRAPAGAAGGARRAAEGAAGLTVGQLERQIGGRTLVAGLFRGNEAVTADPDQKIEAGDIVALIGVRERLVNAGERVGVEVLPPAAHHDVLQLDERQVIVNKPGLNGRTLGDLARAATQRHIRFVWVQQIMRSGMSLPITPATQLLHGDRLTLVGTDPALSAAAQELGTAVRHVDTTDLVFLCVGILLGLLVGMLSVTVSRDSDLARQRRRGAAERAGVRLDQLQAARAGGHAAGWRPVAEGPRLGDICRQRGIVGGAGCHHAGARAWRDAAAGRPRRVAGAGLPVAMDRPRVPEDRGPVADWRHRRAARRARRRSAPSWPPARVRCRCSATR